ncbi:hypothetical protein PGB90_002340 [Kerria lacca]
MMATVTKDEEHEAVTNFRKYLRIKSVHPDIDYDECVKFIIQLGKDVGLQVQVINVEIKKPIVILSLIGNNPELPSVLLNSHMDVVPVDPEFWSYDPFGAEKTVNGNIYGRGAQDMKCIGIQYIETIRKYRKEGLNFKRTIHLSFVPDEEIGGELGMAKFVLTEEFKKLNVGFALDEGMPTPTNEFMLAYAERAIWHVSIICPGTAGHGSLLLENTAGEKIQYIINKFMAFRAKEKEKLKSNPNLTLGDVTTVNLTILEGGVQSNVVPAELKVTFDLRVANNVEHDELEKTIQTWCEEAGEDVRINFIVKQPKMGSTELNECNPWWVAFKNECDKMKLTLKPVVFPGGTDSRYLRNICIPAIGFSPINNTPNLLHSNNEFLNEKTFLRGLDIYYNIIKSLASV